MEEFIKFLNNKTNNKYEYLKLNEVTYDKQSNSLFLVFLYPDEKGNIEELERKEMLSILKEYLDLNVKITIKYIKSYYDKQHLIEKVKAFNEKEFPAITSLLKVEELIISENDNNIEVTINFLKGYISNEQQKKYSMLLEQYLNSEFYYNFLVNLVEVEEVLNGSIIEEKKNEIKEQVMNALPKQKTLKVEVLEQIVGDDTNLTPMCVSSIVSEEKNIAIGGVVKYFSEREFTKKQQVMDAEEERYNEVKKTYYSFSLESAGKEINAVYFPNAQAKNNNITVLQDGYEVVVVGDVEKFNDRLSIRVKHITKVKIQNKPVENIKYNSVPTTYKRVFPEPFEVVSQASLFDSFNEPCDYLKNNTFVVFDLETTGLNHEDCQIVEIGAVKIEQGKITTKFSTFVDPEVEIPLDATAIHGITDAMVMGAPKVNEALADFYKYCENSTLVAYNIDFDFKFIHYYGRKNGFLFNHTQKDAMVLAKQRIKGLKNYKLKTVCESLGVNLTNAHRAYFDAAATAEVFLKLVEKEKNA